MSMFAGLRRERVEASPQFDGKTFRNPPRSVRGVVADPNPLPVMREYFFGGGEREPKATLPIVRPHDAWSVAPSQKLRATWLGHSTVLLEIDGFRVLTDPVFGLRASPVSFAGPKRFHPAPATIHELPELDAVLLSHDHYDHMCAPTIRALAGMHMPIITSLGVGARLESMGVAKDRIHELDWGEQVDIRGLRFTATPCQHFSGRTAFDRNRTLWSSWVIAGDDTKVFFSGDTGLTDQFQDIGSAHGPFDLVMLEIGAFHEAWGDMHLGPENALKAFSMLGGGTLLPVHWGTFNLALHDWHEPAETLLQLAKGEGARVLTPKLGEVFVPSEVEGPAPWWRNLTS
ncbi:MAG: L-ascorbate metabolism protein UlaG (beta-lactamase superfamily) [Polyangiales bacterium]|jgi:L-ascorbate metabolism protein UlaG (beta-lactamase superfamily)